MKKLLAPLAVIALLVLCPTLLNPVYAQQSLPVPTPRTGAWSCELSAFFAGTKPESNELKGSGMLMCKNARGFAIEQAVEGNIVISQEASGAANRSDPVRITFESETFALIRDLNQVYGEFEPQSDSSRTLTEPTSGMVLVSSDRKVVIPMKISLPHSSLGKWQIMQVNLISKQL